ncbi:hypothetical protein BMS3Abin07_02289 [bacterium BMS3Abin07]|nr:hypothetical protein BMS3Abin07_02289 [bacterium BMS3Abin07]GBE32382.1 hypothetical protein BMS3Bbin05_01297 [bacterium BMS3Bbin05]HDL19868.1 hypothetical protein [Nitrospirota bacterium]HDO21261.1 hypothetical protein [Nitrospirota bacterium]HDZ87277.1 hypothetical protein [Nitrospirota bacterium]
MKKDKYGNANSVTLITETVLCDSKVSLNAHKELFRFQRGKYIICDSSPIQYIMDMNPASQKLHLSLLWDRILNIALWKDKINLSDLIYLLKNIGFNDAELDPFRNGETGDIFPALYFGSNFDALRKICNMAKRVAEDKLKGNGIKVICHMVSEETGRIVASSP